MKVTVLYGGPSAEREISLVSGAAVAKGLREMGHEVFESDVSPTHLSGLDHPHDVIFPVLHGEFGESGELQEILEARGLAFVGSGSKASKIGMNKAETKAVWEKFGIPTPKSAVVTDTAVPFPGPAVVKAIDSGSSIDVLVCKDPDKVPAAIAEVVTKHGRALVEQFVAGTELTVGILEDRALHPIRITTTHEFFDFNAKYKGNDAQHHFDLQLPPEVVKHVQATALKAHNAIGCRDLSRVDVIVDKDMNPWLLEINTLPGFTPKSLLPEMAAHEGIAFGQLCDLLVKRAYNRRKTAA